MPESSTDPAPRTSARGALVAVALSTCIVLSLGGCSPKWYRQDADKVAYDIIDAAQESALGKTEPFTIEPASMTLRRQLLEAQDLPYSSPASLGSDQLPRIAHWPEKEYPYAAAEVPPLPPGPLKITLNDALQIAARNNREYQTRKEDVFRAALALDLERNDFRYLLFASNDTRYIDDPAIGPDVRGLENTSSATMTKRFKNGAAVSLAIGLDLVKLLTQERSETLGLVADATITIPLLRGAGKHIVTEPLTQAERDVVYELLSLERFKRTLAVNVASEYLRVLQRADEIKNNEENYRGLIVVTRRANRLAEAGRMSQTEVDQARQDELRARDSWGIAIFNYKRARDNFKLTLGLPGDAEIELDDSELDRLGKLLEQIGEPPPTTVAMDEATSQPATVLEAQASIVLIPPGREEGQLLDMDPAEAVEQALTHRLDLRVAEGEVHDAQRQVVVAANMLLTDLTFAGVGTAGARRSLASAGLPNAELRPEIGEYAAALRVDLPLERTEERNLYRRALIFLEQAVRDAQELEDEIKVQVRDDLWTLIAARNSARIQTQAVNLARRRVQGEEMRLDAGRAEMRDLLEAREALIGAQNNASAALVAYRVAELELQADMGVLEIDEKGLWREYQPTKDTAK